MENGRFDAVVRVLARGTSRRTAAGLLAVLAGVGPPALPVEGKHRHKKRTTLCHDGQTIKVPKKQVKAHLAQGDTLGACAPGPCHTLGEACAGHCCASLACGANSCGATNVCLLPRGLCASECDCLAGRHCSDRFDDTCSVCRLAQETCAVGGDCCRLAAACGTNACGQANRCCLELLSPCEANCDCCGEKTDCALDNNDHQVCCRKIGGICAGNDDCCFGLDCRGPNDTCCVGFDGGCGNDDDCCPGLACSSQTGTCLQPSG